MGIGNQFLSKITTLSSFSSCRESRSYTRIRKLTSAENYYSSCASILYSTIGEPTFQDFAQINHINQENKQQRQLYNF